MALCTSCGHELAGSEKFCPECGAAPASDAELVDGLRKRVADLERRMDATVDVVNQYGVLTNNHERTLASSKVFSPKFNTRAWAIWGHVFVVGLFISLILLILNQLTVWW